MVKSRITYRGGEKIAGGYDQPLIAKYKGRGKGPRTKKQMREKRLREQMDKEMDKVRFANITKGTHI